MTAATGVLVFFGALGVWIALFVYGAARRAFGPFLVFGIGLMLFLNGRYLVEGATDGIAFFIGIYDVLMNIGLEPGETSGAVMACPDNACTVWGETYVNHSAWGVAFYDRFATGPEFRSTLLYGHIVGNSMAFLLLHVQMARPGMRHSGHRILGWLTLLFLSLGVFCAVWLASEHGPVVEYGSALSAYGFYSMSFFVSACAIMGVVAIRSGDHARHRVWMWRFAGSMWGSFWLFRVVLFVIDPLLRDHAAVAIQICIWGSAPAGILLAELVRCRIDRGRQSRLRTIAAE